MSKFNRLLCIFAFSGCVLATPSRAVDSVSFELGKGDGAEMGRIGIQWDLKKRWFQGANWHLGSYIDLSIGYWQRDGFPGQNESLAEIGLTPVLRLQQNDLRGLFFEFASGPHVLSKTSLAEKRFSTMFQFGSHVGVGYRFGPKGQYDVAYRYQHLSNASIKRPNNGINFNQIRLQYHF